MDYINRLDVNLVLGVSVSAYYRRATDCRSPRAIEDDRLIGLIKELYIQSHETYGYRRMWRALTERGEAVGRGHVRRLMHRLRSEGSGRRGLPQRPGQA